MNFLSSSWQRSLWRTAPWIESPVCILTRKTRAGRIIRSVISKFADNWRNWTKSWFYGPAFWGYFIAKSSCLIFFLKHHCYAMDRSGFEPEASCLQSRRSTADLPALSIGDIDLFIKSVEASGLHAGPVTPQGSPWMCCKPDRMIRNINYLTVLV